MNTTFWVLVNEQGELRSNTPLPAPLIAALHMAFDEGQLPMTTPITALRVTLTETSLNGQHTGSFEIEAGRASELEWVSTKVLPAVNVHWDGVPKA